MVMSVVGLWRWRFGGEGGVEKPITTLNLSGHSAAIILGILISIFLIFISQYFDDISFRVLDAFTTVFMVVGTVLLIERKLTSWIYLVVCDVIYVYIYSNLDAWLFVGMMIVYAVLGTVGYLEWKKLYDRESGGDSLINSFGAD